MMTPIERVAIFPLTPSHPADATLPNASGLSVPRALGGPTWSSARYADKILKTVSGRRSFGVGAGIAARPRKNGPGVYNGPADAVLGPFWDGSPHLPSKCGDPPPPSCGKIGGT